MSPTSCGRRLVQLVAGGPEPRGAYQVLAPRSPCLARFSSACSLPFLCLSFGALLPQRRGLGFLPALLMELGGGRHWSRLLQRLRTALAEEGDVISDMPAALRQARSLTRGQLSSCWCSVGGVGTACLCTLSLVVACLFTNMMGDARV